MQLRQPEALGVFDHHDRRVRHVDADLDDGGGDEDLGFPGGEGGHGSVLLLALHAPVHQPHPVAEQTLQVRVAVLGGGDVEDFRFLDQRTHPIDAGAGFEGPLQPLRHLVQTLDGHDPGIHRHPPGRLVVQARHVHVAVGRQHQRPGDRRRGHDENVHGPALGRQGQALMDAETVLFVDHRHGQRLECDVVLKKRVRADGQRRLARRKLFEDRFPGLAFLAPGQQHHLDSGGPGQGFDGRQMLAGEDFRRRHHCRLLAGLDGAQHR